MLSLDLVAATDMGWSAGLGRVGAVTESRGLVAVATSFPLLYWPGRAFYEGHRLGHRVVVYDSEKRVRIGTFDSLRYPVHEIAIHPTEPILAIGTGAYDGGYAYEGQLIVWNWVTREVWWPLLDREVVRVRWQGPVLVVLVKPRTDEDEEQTGPVLYDGIVRPFTTTPGPENAISATPTTSTALGFDGAEAPRSPWIDEQGHVARPHVWDLAFVDGGSIAAVSDAGVALWDARLRRSRAIDTPGRAVQLLHSRSRLLVHTIERVESRDVSVLYALRGPDLQHLRTFDRPYLFSVDGAGRILGRDVRGSGLPPRDLLMDGSLTPLTGGDFGHFDVFNHALRVDGGEHPTFLRGTPSTSHQRKVVCQVAWNGTIVERMPWDDGDAHRMSPTACWAGPDALIAGWYTHHPHPGKGRPFIERRDIGSSGPKWRVQLPFAPIALAWAESIGAVAWATLEGEIGLLDAATGAMVARERIVVDGLAAPPTAIGVREDQLAVGTLDGRILLFKLPRPS